MGPIRLGLFGSAVAEATVDVRGGGFDPGARLEVDIEEAGDRIPAKRQELTPAFELARELTVRVEIQFPRQTAHAIHGASYRGK